MHYLYRITNQLNNKVYIGQTIRPKERWKQHQYLSSRKDPSQCIHRAMAEDGPSNFVYEIIAMTRSVQDANASESILIEQYDSRNPDKGYNVRPGGQRWDDAAIEQMSEAIRQFYRDHPEERERVSQQSKAMWEDPNHLSKVLEARDPDWVHPMKGKSLSEERRLKIVEGVRHLRGVSRPAPSEAAKQKARDTIASKSDEEKADITRRTTISRGFVSLSDEQKQAIIDDSRSSRAIAPEYGVEASTIQRIKKKAGRGRVILTDAQKQAIIDDPRIAALVASDYGVSPSKIYSVRKGKH